MKKRATWTRTYDAKWSLRGSWRDERGENPARYSCRKAAMGSRRAAFNAGQMPKKRPMLVATVKPATTDQTGTLEGRLGTKVRIARLNSQPTRMPIMPPDAVRVMASSRKVQVISLRRAATG